MKVNINKLPGFNRYIVECKSRRQACAVNRFKKKAVTKCPAAICAAGHPVAVPSELHKYSRNGSAVFKFLITASSRICHL